MTQTFASPVNVDPRSPAPAYSDSGEKPIGDAEFDGFMARFAPFERAPHVAVAVSGGADSLALALLVQRWVRGRGGRVTALIVDHRLRPESAAEAAQTGAWLAARGIDQRVLAWDTPKPAAGVQAAARAARRDLLIGWCRREGVLHLLLAHHRDDQTETIVLRLVRRSGPDGLAGMAAAVELADLRLLRPLLGVAPGRLGATLRAAHQPWIEDPSNGDHRFARVRIRAALAQMLAQGLDPGALVAAIHGLGRDRGARERAVAELLARIATIYPEGFAVIDPAGLLAAERSVSMPALARVVLAIGGNAYPPRSERIERLHAAVASQLGGGRTLGGCRLAPWRKALLVAREAAAGAGEIVLHGPGVHVLDDRFTINVAGRGPFAGCRLGPLGDDGWRHVLAAGPDPRRRAIPLEARRNLPTLWDLDGVREVPHLLYRRRGADPVSVTIVSVTFRPRHPLAGSGFSAF